MRGCTLIICHTVKYSIRRGSSGIVCGESYEDDDLEDYDLLR